MMTDRAPPARRGPRSPARRPWVPAALARAALAVLAATVAVPAAGPVRAEAVGAGLQHDSDQPIAIDADALELRQQEKVAIFTGNVKARQGDLHLTAAQVKVHYSGGESRSGTEGGAAAISRIDAEGKVFLSTPRETAEGESAVYDVNKRIVTLKRNVVLTRGDNVLRGNELVLDLDSGRSTLDSRGSGGRVRGLFVPGGE